jgi:hypothetical protein
MCLEPRDTGQRPETERFCLGLAVCQFKPVTVASQRFGTSYEYTFSGSQTLAVPVPLRVYLRIDR